MLLLGEGQLDGLSFGDSDTDNPRPRYWWREHLRAAIASQSEAQPVYLLCVDKEQELYEFVAPEYAEELRRHTTVETYYIAPPSAKAIETAALMKAVEVAFYFQDKEAIRALITPEGKTALEEFGWDVAQAILSARMEELLDGNDVLTIVKQVMEGEK